MEHGEYKVVVVEYGDEASQAAAQELLVEIMVEILADVLPAEVGE